MTHAHVDNRLPDQSDWPEVLEGLFTGHRLAPDECITGQAFDAGDQQHLFNIGGNGILAAQLNWVDIRLSLSSCPFGPLKASLYLVEKRLNRTIALAHWDIDPGVWTPASDRLPLECNYRHAISKMLDSEHRYLLHFTSTDNALIKGHVECLISTN